MTAGLDTSTVVTAIVAAAALLAIVGFTKWGAKKLGRFFG
ncbi:MAG: capsid protein [Gammaproteobacteria bacterium]